MSLNENMNWELQKHDMNNQEIQSLLYEPLLSRVFPI